MMLTTVTAVDKGSSVTQSTLSVSPNLCLLSAVGLQLASGARRWLKLLRSKSMFFLLPLHPPTPPAGVCVAGEIRDRAAAAGSMRGGDFRRRRDPLAPS